MIAVQHKWTILVVDDEEATREAIAESLIAQGHDVIISPSASDTIIKVTQMRFDLAILDILMPDISGFELINVMNKICPETVLIILTAMANPTAQFGITAEETGVFAFLKKPCKLQDLNKIVQEAIEHKKSISKNPEMKIIL